MVRALAPHRQDACATSFTSEMETLALATSGVISSLLSTQIRPPNQDNYQSINEAFGLSMGGGSITVIICFLIVLISRNFRHRF